MYSSGLSLVGFFTVFVAAQFLVSAVPFWASLHRWAVPAGALLGGIIVSRGENREIGVPPKTSTGSSEPHKRASDAP